MGATRLLRHGPHDVAAPGSDELAAAQVVAGQSATTANLVFPRDKGVPLR
ncbi:MAG: hypothetical protein R2708_24045 [Vicinamibacterales bacterium]